MNGVLYGGDWPHLIYINRMRSFINAFSALIYSSPLMADHTDHSTCQYVLIK